MNYNRCITAIFALLLALVSSYALGTQESMDHSNHAGVDHSKHKAMMSKPKGFQRTQDTYQLPVVTLFDQSGEAVAVDELDNGNRPQAVNFIFATCTTICPVMTATFAQMRRELGADADRIDMVSITIDPEHDTSAVLSEYAGRFDAPPPPEWRFLTGHPEDVEQVLRAFDAWSGSKANHRPITLLRGAGEQDWIRLEGLGSGADLAAEAMALLN